MENVQFVDIIKNIQIEDKIVEINGKKIVIKQFLPMEEKIKLIERIVNNSFDESGNVNSVKFLLIFDLELVFTYSNIEFSEADKEKIYNLHDLLELNGILKKVKEGIPSKEYDFIYSHSENTLKTVTEFFRSALGILQRAQTDYSGLDLDTDELIAKFADIDNLDQVKEIISKLG